MFKKFHKRIFPVLLTLVMVFSIMPMQVFAASTVSVLDGKISITDTATSTTASGNTVTVTAKGGLLSQTTNKITIKNAGDSTATISFDYSASNYSAFSESASSGTISKGLAVGQSFTMSITGKKAWSSNTATLTLSNFAYEVSSEELDVTLKFDSAMGSVTALGNAVSNGDVITVSDGTLPVVATPASGHKFYAWINADTHEILSTSATYSVAVLANIAVEAIFADNSVSNAYFYADDEKYLFDDLNEAGQFAATLSNKTIVLMANGTLPVGSYTIPSGVTLLIPFNSANTCYTTAPGLYETADSFNVTPTAYRTLIMESGANITVNGAISVSAQANASGGAKVGAGAPVGPCGFIKMNTSSSVILNSGASLYAWGFITGEGSILAKSGSKVYENFQIQDFRGGNAFSDLDNRVFTTSQYYVQNIEVALTLESGATEYSYTAINITLLGKQGSSVAFISNEDAMFNLTSGSVTKRYDGNTDRMIIQADGDMTVSPITMKISVYSLNSSEYVLPINNNFTVIANSGTMNIKQDIALLPGAEIIVRENAKCVFGSGVKAYIYDADEWGGYCGGANQKFIPVQYAPGKKYTRTESDLKDALVQIDGEIDASAAEIYTTKGGANIISTNAGKVLVTAGTQTVTYQAVQSGNTISSYPEIPIIPAVLKNADGSYTETASATDTTYNYNSTHGKWDSNNHTIADIVTGPTCTEQGFTTHTCTCGYSYIDTYVAATGHSYGDWTINKEPTYSQEGSKTHSCSVCTHEETVAIEKNAVPDIDGDGDFDAIDLVKLRKIILGIDTLPESVYTTISDLNDDTKVNILDLIRIKKLSLAK